MFKAIRSPEQPGPSGTDTIMQLTFPIAAVTEAYPMPAPPRDETRQLRVDITLADAEDLVEGLQSLIATAKAQEPDTAQPTALALAGLKIGAEPKPAPPRFSPAQLEALSRMPIRRGLNLGPDGRPRHALGTPAFPLHKPARIAG